MGFTRVILAAAFCLSSAHEALAQDKTSEDEALIQAAEKLIKEGEAAPAPLSEPAAKAAADSGASAAAAPAGEMKESEIPVVLGAKTGSSAGTQNVVWRLLASLAVIALTGGALFYASRRWSRQKDKTGGKARVEILNQLHLGPRKNISLIRVSGETMLIGVTDHSINLIKSVTLIDDELEGVLGGGGFNNFLEDEFTVEDVRTALNARA